ncbi:C-5 cytosine-specific DNA methylase [Xanthobacter versatilis]|uniref:DNA (cytosine-5-)-methyltransferase n=1 Tax=Xanthobacter autotrophicus (strain ATCC BAA-1158 / Py2) TaxID=78245 RepID=A7ILN3_XANP2|nr:C-5 cytosine-specific DNA methylase [Xanthobacter autotrophicus Py2]
MKTPFLLDNRITVVLFAGMGGGCDGLEEAGFHVHVAINHDPVAVAVHERRHPHTKHLRCDVFEADPREVCRGRGVRALHASPDCTHFSVAKGSKPVSSRRRSLAWVICRWAGTVRPETITLENVQEITTWCPLIAKRDPATGRVLRLDGTVAAKGERVPVQEQWLIPDPKHKGRIWRAWLKHLRGLGYSFEHRVLVCADYGVPTIRKRLFGVAQADGRPIVWPARTHAPRKDAKRLGLKPWVGAHTIIDWSLPVKSIFDRAKALADASHRRIAHGVVRHVLEAVQPFIVPITHTQGGNSARSTSEPLCTITTAKGGENMVAVPTLIQSGYGEREGQAPRVLDLMEPAATQVGGSKAALVAAFLAQHNAGPRPGAPARAAIEPVSTITTTGAQQSIAAISLMRQFGTGLSRDAREPVPTITVEGQTKTGLVAATLGEMRGRSRGGRDVREPLAAVSAKSHAHLILPFLQHYYSNGKTDDDVQSPLGALTSKARYGIVEVKVRGETFIIDDIGTRMLEPEEGAAAHGFKPGALPDEVTVDGETRRLTKTQKYHLVGNSVPPRMIQLLAECNVRRALAEAAE